MFSKMTIKADRLGIKILKLIREGQVGCCCFDDWLIILDSLNRVVNKLLRIEGCDGSVGEDESRERNKL